MPGQPGNRNAISNGTMSVFRTGKWPKGASYIAKIGRKVRQALEDEVLDVHGEVGLYHSGLCQTAARNEIIALLLQRWLREDGELDTEAKSRLLDRIANASARRDAAVKQLGIDRRRTTDAFSRIIEQASDLPEETAAEPPDGDTDGPEAREATESSDAADGKSGDPDGTHHRNGKNGQQAP
ncbi:MAG: hypothetical protein WDZ59_11800 [Pirellulales bacterium]